MTKNGPPVRGRARIEHLRDVRVIHHRERLPLTRREQFTHARLQFSIIATRLGHEGRALRRRTLEC